MPSAPLLSRTLSVSLCRALRACDGGLTAVLLVGSGVYAPSLARDLDLLVVSAAPRRPTVYEGVMRAVLAGLPAVDVLVRRTDEGPGALRLAIASGKPLWRRSAEVPLLIAARATMADFAEARKRVALASGLMESGARTPGDFAAPFAEEAFETLYRASRLAVMAFLGSRVRRRLPAPLRAGFEALAATCHLRYGVGGHPPSGRRVLEAEFARWHGRALRVIATAEAAAGSGRAPLAAGGAAPPAPAEAAEDHALYLEG